MKAVYDTCLYVDLLRDSSRLTLFNDRKMVRFLSPIVLMELLAGVRTTRQKRAVHSLLDPYSRANRLIPLNSRVYFKAGECLARIGEFHLGLSHDILIALSALSIGAVLFTSNKKDFSRIGKYVPALIEYV
jgi:predicted nucleic acid-binding protein